MIIKDGTGKGYEAKVNSEGLIGVDAVVNSRQHHNSIEHAQSFQASSTTNIAAAKTDAFVMTNDGNSDIIVTYIRLMSIGAAAASSAAYFTIEVGGAYTSGGTAVTPTNMNVGNQKVATASVYSGATALTVDSNYVEIDRNYEANSMQSYNKDGSIVLTRGASLLITHTGSTAAGVAYARVSFYVAQDRT